MSRTGKTPEVIFSFEEDNHDKAVGLYKPNANTITLWLTELRTPADLYNNLEHEGLHSGIDSEDLLEEEEHTIIKNMQMMKDDMY